ncbi:MAG: PIN domain-containing protein [Chloroflexi bacterium]|nr:PIN domain-containing protein [Chloroflexota bacterium]
MSNRIFIDTLFVIALINQRDAYHERALEAADKYERAGFLTTDAVLLEIGNALARNFKQQAVEVIDSFLSSDEVDIVRLTPDIFAQAYALYRRYEDKTWGLIDCVSFVVMRDAGIRRALTFDHHFVQAGFEALMRD